MATASKKAQELAEQLLGITPSAVEATMAGDMAAMRKSGAGFAAIKGFYGKNRMVMLTAGAVALVSVLGVGGMVWYKRMKAKEQPPQPSQ